MSKPMPPMPPTPLRQEDYLAIEAAVMETARGRWFLAEYTRRNRNADTDTLLTAIDKLEKTIVRDRAPASLMKQVHMDLSDMAAAIEKTKREIAQIKHEDNEGSERFERASIELDAIVSQTETATSDILGAAEKIQEYAWTLRELGADSSKCDELDMEATNIYMACSFQDLTGQRIRKIVDAMRYVESRINKMIEIWGFEGGSMDVDKDDIKRDDARPDAHLLNGPALTGEGVKQNDVDMLFDTPANFEETDQDQVDALFDNDAAEPAAFDRTIEEAEPEQGTDEFEAVAVDQEDYSVEDSATEADDLSSKRESDQDGTEYVDFLDMEDLDWAEIEPTDAAQDLEIVQSTDSDIGAVSELEADADQHQADVFASEAVKSKMPEPNEPLDQQAADDLFAQIDEDLAGADVFNVAVESDNLDAENVVVSDLSDRVAQFS